MSGWILWLVVACGFGVGEVTLTTGFWLAPFALGAAIAAAADAAGAPEPVDFIVFVVFTITALLMLRPFMASRLMTTTPALRTGADALVGQQALVIEPIANAVHAGTVRIGGEVWSARAFDDGQEIPAGTTVHIMEIRGATALVLE
jgi:membrane protein implicated in regulation of membrane protease activity